MPSMLDSEVSRVPKEHGDGSPVLSRRLTQQSEQSLNLLSDLDQRLTGIEQFLFATAKLFEKDPASISLEELVKIKNELIEGEHNLNNLQFGEIDAVQTVHLTTGKDEVKAERKMLVKRCEPAAKEFENIFAIINKLLGDKREEQKMSPKADRKVDLDGAVEPSVDRKTVPKKPSYLDQLDESDKPEQSPDSFAGLYTAVADYVSSENNQLSFSKDAQIKVTRAEPSGWAYGESSGKTGWCPFGHLKKIDDVSGGPHSQPTPLPAKAPSVRKDRSTDSGSKIGKTGWGWFRSWNPFRKK